MHTTTFRAMGTDVEIMICESNLQSLSDVHHATQLAREKISTLESLLSRFLTTSDVSRINARFGQWMEVARETIQVLILAQHAFQRSNGFFNPFLGQRMQDLGYNMTFEQIESDLGCKLSVGEPFVAPLHSPLQIEEQTCRARIEPGYRIDLGGIAKGWIVERAANILVENGITSFICNAGGDLVTRGTNAGSPWVIGIRDPFNPLKHVLNVDVQNITIATSGTYRRKWSRGTRQMHHILDPFSGEPVDTDIVSCSVLHRSLVEAEVLAKVALILGTTQGIPWLRRQNVTGWIVAKNTGEVEYTCNL